MIINRPGIRNAVKGSAAATLAESLRDFAPARRTNVTVLHDAIGTSCTGTNLKAGHP